MITARHYKFIASWALLIAAITVVFGCGGGTNGSGLNNYDGRVSTAQGVPLSDVAITIETTGDHTTTNNNGEFSLASEASGSSVAFLLESPEFKSSFVLNDIPEEQSRIGLQIVVDTTSDAVMVSKFSVKAGMVGLCDYYFENNATIRQANKVPEGTHCSLNVEVAGDGARLAQIPVALQYSSCEPNAPWKTLVTTKTGTGKSTGAAEVNFEFHDSPTYCRYRVVAPFNYPPYRPVYYPIDTFSEQAMVRRDF